MTVVSLCICLLLAPLSIGYFHSYTLIGNPYEHESFSYQLSLASARMMEYPTIAGAIDTYAKGIVSNDEQFYYQFYHNRIIMIFDLYSVKDLILLYLISLIIYMMSYI